MNLKLKAFICCVLCIFICLFLYKFKSPFMFSDIKEVSSSDLYKEPNYILKNYNLNFNQSIGENELQKINKFFKKFSVLNNNNFYSDMLSVTNATQNLMTFGSTSNKDKYRTLENILDISGEYRNVCSEAAKISTIFWQILGYKSRVIWGGNHVATEVFNKEYQKWILVDSDGGIYAKYNGKFLNFLETREFAKKDKNVFIDIKTNNTTRNGKYNIDLYGRTQFFVLISSVDLFTYHIKFRDPFYILKYIFLDTKDEINALQSSEPKYKKLGNKEIM